MKVSTVFADFCFTNRVTRYQHQREAVTGFVEKHSFDCFSEQAGKQKFFSIDCYVYESATNGRDAFITQR